MRSFDVNARALLLRKYSSAMPGFPGSKLKENKQERILTNDMEMWTNERMMFTAANKHIYVQSMEFHLEKKEVAAFQEL